MRLVVALALLVACSSSPPANVRVRGPVRFNHCAIGFTYAGEPFRFCTRSRALCELAVKTARQHGRSFLIRRQARVARLGGCRKVWRI